VKAVALILGALAVVALLWIAAEMHYANCIEAVRATPPVRDPYTVPSDVIREDIARRRAIRACSRLPF
jgi:hypothetical protein